MLELALTKVLVIAIAGVAIIIHMNIAILVGIKVAHGLHLIDTWQNAANIRDYSVTVKSKQELSIHNVMDTIFIEV